MTLLSLFEKPEDADFLRSNLIGEKDDVFQLVTGRGILLEEPDVFVVDRQSGGEI